MEGWVSNLSETGIDPANYSKFNTAILGAKWVESNLGYCRKSSFRLQNVAGALDSFAFTGASSADFC